MFFCFSRDRDGEHMSEVPKGLQGVLQVDAYASCNQFYQGGRKPGPVLSALCSSNVRRKFFDLADIEGNIRRGKEANEILQVAFKAVRRRSTTCSRSGAT